MRQLRRRVPWRRVSAALWAAWVLAGAAVAGVAKAGEPANVVSRPAFARSGAWVAYEPRPRLARELRACSFRHPACVHGGTDGETLALLDAADRAWDTAVGALDLPAPDTSPFTGALDLYLVDGDPYATRVVLDARDPLGGFDRASVFALVGRGVRAGCSLDATAAQVITRAALWRAAPATDDASATAETTYLESLITPCAPAPVAGLLAFQAHPEFGLTDPFRPPSESLGPPPARVSTSASETYATGASSFYSWADGRFATAPGALVRAIWALSPTLTPWGAARWDNEPDGFDVLRMTFREALGTKSTVDDLWLEFAVARALGATYPVRREWSIEWPTRPRSLSSGSGVAPTGAAYVAVACGGRPKGSRLRFEASWEEHAKMLWTLVRLDGDGRERSRVGVPGRERGTDAQMTLVDLDDTASLLIVGTNVGDPLYPFDPDDYAQEPHGWTVSLASEEP